MKRIATQEYTAQFKEQAVGMVKSGKGVPEVARALCLVEQTLRNWVKLAAQGKLHQEAKRSRPSRWSFCGCGRRTHALRHALLDEPRGQLLGQRAQRELL